MNPARDIGSGTGIGHQTLTGFIKLQMPDQSIQIASIDQKIASRDDLRSLAASMQ